jgi:hydrogenase maturation protease
MSDLRQQLESCLHGRVALMGIGNVDYGDDGFGVYLARSLSAEGGSNVVVAGNTPERFIGRIADEGYDSVVFLDAVEFGGAPGSAVLLNSEEMTTRFPQVSTHKISLGLLAKWVESNGVTKAWLLGVQPESLRASAQLTATMQTTLGALAELLCDVLFTRHKPGAPRTRRTEEARV